MVSSASSPEPLLPPTHPRLELPPPTPDQPYALPVTEAFGRGELAPPTEAFGTGTPTKKKKPEEQKKQKQDDDKNPDDHENDEEEKTDEKNEAEDQEQKPKKPPLYKRPLFWIITIPILVLLIIAAIAFWLYERQFVRTDDAYIDGNVTQIAPQVSAPVLRLHVDDNVLVNAGDLLVELDPTDFQVALEQAQAAESSARAKVAQAAAQIDAAAATVRQYQAEVDAAQVQLDNAARDLQRYQNVDPRARSQQQLDNAESAEKNAEASLEQARARFASAQANVTTSTASVKAAQGDLDKSIADEHRATVNLGYCKIIAPSAGRITSRSINPGSYVTPGQAMFSIVSPDVWVTANFKETQLTNMKLGQPVLIKIDAFPDRSWNGRIDSIQAGSGARFSVLPAENATGNFVKTVQRIPVKITFDHPLNTDDSHLLSPGLSVRPRVTVR